MIAVVSERLLSPEWGMLRGYMGFFGLLCHVLKNGLVKLWTTELDGVSGLFWG